MTIKKYELTNETMVVDGRTVYRIKAIRDVGTDYPKEGKLGGFVESERNLSHDGDCWIGENAIVYGNAVVSDSAKISGYARVYEAAQISGRSSVYGEAKIHGTAKVSGYSFIYGCAELYNNAQVNGRAKVKKIKIKGENDMDVVITPSGARIYDDAKVFEDATVSGYPRVCGDAKLRGKAEIYGDAHVKTGVLSADIFADFNQYVYCATGLKPENGYYRVYKKVFKTAPGEYRSPYYRDFTYKDGMVSEATDVNEERLDISGAGLHVLLSPADGEGIYGDTLIAVDVAPEDIVACAWGMLRVRKLKVVGQL